MTEDRVNRIHVRTPEGVMFTFPLAGAVSRCIAWVVDTVLIGAASSAVGFVLIWFAIVSMDWTVAVLTVLYFVVGTGYNMAFEWRWRGQTPGKRLLRIRVVDASGMPLVPQQIILRNLVRILDQLPATYLVGGVAMILSRRAQRLGDLAAGTIVVRHRRISEPDMAALLQERFNSLREQPRLASQLRQRVPPVLAAAAVDALTRRNDLEPAARVELFAELARAFRGLVSLPPDLVADLPDEALVRNIVEVIHARASEFGAGSNLPSNAGIGLHASGDSGGR